LGWLLYCHPNTRVRQYNCRTNGVASLTARVDRHTIAAS
jgi:hypothetical protein